MHATHAHSRPPAHAWAVADHITVSNSVAVVETLSGTGNRAAMGGSASKAAGAAGTAAARKLPTQARPDALKEAAAAVSARPPPPEASAPPPRPPAAAAPPRPPPPAGAVHEKDEGLLNKLASLQSSVERITQTPSGLQLVRRGAQGQPGPLTPSSRAGRCPQGRWVRV